MQQSMKSPHKSSLTCGSWPHQMTADLILFEESLHLQLYGGVKPHIGAQCIGKETPTVEERETHKEGAISLEIWKRLQETFEGYYLSVQVGMHVPNATKEDIELLLKNAREVVTLLLKNHSSTDSI